MASDPHRARVHRLLLGEAERAYAGRVPGNDVICAYCGDPVNRADAYESRDGPLCARCAAHPRFDFDACPACGQPWAETMQPCPFCNLTVEEVAERCAQ